MKYLIVSYRQAYEKRTGCHCHPERETKAGSLEIKAVDLFEEMASYIASRLLLDLEASYCHVIMTEGFGEPTTYDIENFTDPVEIPDNRLHRKFKPGWIIWETATDEERNSLDATILEKLGPLLSR